MLTRTSLSAKARIKQLLYALPVGNYKPVPFIILGAPRSGTTLLHTYLNSHWNIFSHGEYIGRNQRRGRRVDVRSIFERMHLPVVKAAGMKIFYDYFTDPPLKDELKRLQLINDLRIIHLVRINLPEQYVSLQIARQSGEWSGKAKAMRITVNPIECLDYCVKMLDTQRTYEKLFDNSLLIYYEDLTTNPAVTLKIIQEYLSVPDKELKTVLPRQRIGSLSERLANYAEVKRLFQGTTWEKFFS